MINDKNWWKEFLRDGKWKSEKGVKINTVDEEREIKCKKVRNTGWIGRRGERRGFCEDICGKKPFLSTNTF